jgi:GNAT superfamily N-acetyltransferase
MKHKVEIRCPNLNELEALLELTLQMGYQVNSEQLSARLKSILQNDDHILLIAITGDEVVGFIHAFQSLRLTSESFIEICGLAVKDTARGRGTGSMLVEAIEANLKPGQNIRVRCNIIRKKAHRFYTKLGYTCLKDQKVFEKMRE